MGADFTPTLGVYNTVRPFRFWCQKVLPLVYDDSLSYYEMLCKVRDYLNKLIEDVSTAEDNIQDLAEAYAQLEGYVNTYFDSLDVSEEIDAKLDAMVTDGTLTNLIEPIASNIVSEWLEEHITPTTPAVDDSLTVSGAAADAKTVGDLFAKTVMSRSTLHSTDDVNLLQEQGTYYVGVNDIPQNLPTQNAGRLVVFKPYEPNNYTITCQIYFTPTETYYRVSKNITTAADAWDDVDWKTLVDDSAFIDSVTVRATLDSTMDMNNITQNGIYYVSSTLGYPDNLPFNPHNGRVIVFKGSGSSQLNVTQIYVSNYIRQRVYIRVSKNYTDSATAWDGVEWSEILTEDLQNQVAMLDPIRVKIPLITSTMQSTGRYSNPGWNRMRPVNSYYGLYNFKLAGHKIRFYYYDGQYDYDESRLNVNPTNYLYTTPWQNIDEPVSPEAGLWFVFMIAKQNDTNFTPEERDYVNENLEIYSDKACPIVIQNHLVPYDALTYHAQWDSIVDGKVVKRTLLGNADNNADYPIYAYEIHTQRNSMTYNYQNVYYSGGALPYPRKKVLIFAGTHGNEKCTPMDVLALAKELVSGSLKDVGTMFDWYIVPLTNPWGYSHVNLDSEGHIIYRYGTVAETVPARVDLNAGVRTNSAGMDINRDFSDVTFVSGGVTYGFQTSEAQILRTYILANKWDVFIDVHQNNQDKQASNYPGANAFAGVGFKTSTDSDYLKSLYKMYDAIEVACKNTNSKLSDYFRRGSDAQPFVVWMRRSCDDASVDLGIACNYLSGFPTGTHGNTLHQDIAAEVPITIETSELAWTYSQLSNQTNTPSVSWYNPIACTCSTNALCELVKSIADSYGTNH